MLPAEGLDDMARRRRETIAPLIGSAFCVRGVFRHGRADSWWPRNQSDALPRGGRHPRPCNRLRRAVADQRRGFGLFHPVREHLPGRRHHRGCRGKGVVETIEFRTTKIRDGDGRVHVLRNGDVKEVINYSKKYAHGGRVGGRGLRCGPALGVCHPAGSAGERVHAENPDVLADTQIDGITAFGVSTMTVRTSTASNPAVTTRRPRRFLAIKEAFDRQASGAARKGLIPEGLAHAGATLRPHALLVSCVRRFSTRLPERGARRPRRDDREHTGSMCGGGAGPRDAPPGSRPKASDAGRCADSAQVRDLQPPAARRTRNPRRPAGRRIVCPATNNAYTSGRCRPPRLASGMCCWIRFRSSRMCRSSTVERRCR